MAGAVGSTASSGVGIASNGVQTADLLALGASGEAAAAAATTAADGVNKVGQIGQMTKLINQKIEACI